MKKLHKDFLSVRHLYQSTRAEVDELPGLPRNQELTDVIDSVSHED